jgi:hypothetical protein
VGRSRFAEGAGKAVLPGVDRGRSVKATTLDVNGGNAWLLTSPSPAESGTGNSASADINRGGEGSKAFHGVVSKGTWATRRVPSGTVMTASPGKELRLSEGGSGLGAKRGLLRLEGVGQIGSKKSKFDVQWGGGQAPALSFMSDLDLVEFLKKHLSKAVHAVFEDILRDPSIKVGSYVRLLRGTSGGVRLMGTAFLDKHLNSPSIRSCTSDCAYTFFSSTAKVGLSDCKS